MLVEFLHNYLSHQFSFDIHLYNQYNLDLQYLLLENYYKFYNLNDSEVYKFFFLYLVGIHFYIHIHNIFDWLTDTIKECKDNQENKNKVHYQGAIDECNLLFKIVYQDYLIFNN